VSDPEARLGFGPFEFHPDTGELTRDGTPVRLAPQPARLLAVLTLRAGELVSREDLRRELWGLETHVDFDAGLNFCASQLRVALGDDAARPSFLQTLPRRGYRFIAPVTRIDAEEPTPRAARAPTWPRSRSLALLGLATLAVAIQLPKGPRDPAPVRLRILPIETIGARPDLAAFGTAVARELSVELSRWPPETLSVVASDAAPQFALSASLWAEEEDVRIAVRLTRGAGGPQVWADSFSPADDPGPAGRASRTGIVIARSVSQQLLRGAEATRPTTRSATANDLYLKGRSLWREENPGLLGASAAAFSAAIAADPGYAAAWAGLADALNAQAWTGVAPPESTYPRAKAAALRAIALAPRQAAGHAALGFARLYFDTDWAGAGRSLGTAVALDPGLASARQWHAAYLSAVGRHDEATAEALAACEQAPLSPGASYSLGRSYLFARRFEQAGVECRRTLELEPRYSPASWCVQLAKAKTLPGADRSAASLAALEPAERHALSGRSQEALEALERAYARRAEGLVFLGVDPSYDSLRDEPRFRTLLQRLGWAPAS
jgi:DNA-binding winged helix-turn-helix (wHTH) protein/tetratricopeptide (TPR) repeat protein